MVVLNANQAAKYLRRMPKGFKYCAFNTDMVSKSYGFKWFVRISCPRRPSAAAFKGAQNGQAWALSNAVDLSNQAP